MMISDDERREVARRLRKCTPPTSYSQAQGGGWAHLCDIALAVGLKREDNPTAWELAQRLADLIEPPRQCPCYDSGRHWCSIHDVPTIDRDALLALAKVLGGMGDRYNEHERYELGTTFKAIADRIREACGVTGDA